MKMKNVKSRIGRSFRRSMAGLLTAAMLVGTEAGAIVTMPLVANAEEVQEDELSSEDLTIDQLAADSVSEIPDDANVVGATEKDQAGAVETDLSGDEITVTDLDNDASQNIEASDAEIVDVTDVSEDADGVDADDYVYVDQTSWHTTFYVMSDGVIHEIQRNTPASSASASSVLGSAGLAEIKEAAGNNEIIEWEVNKNGHYETTISNLSSYSLSPKMDYSFTAVLAGQIAENLYVRAIPAVYYDGRAHVSTLQNVTAKAYKKTVDDLELDICYVPDGKTVNDAESLRYGVDYKVTYKNNVNASMKMNDDGTYERLNLTDAKRPQVQITGLGNYAGFSALAYFDILPYNIGELNQFLNYNFVAEISGLSSSYVLKNGKLSGTINPKVSYYNSYNDSYTTLKKNKDYVIRLYRYDEAGKWVNRERVDDTGRWLCTVRGIGNYCGTAFGQAYNTKNAVFNDGTQGSTINPAVCTYQTASVPAAQFKVEDISLDISKAKITIKKTSVPYKHGKYYSATDDLGIVVKLGTYELTEGTHYTVIFDGEDYEYITSKDNSGAYSLVESDARFVGKVWMANKYRVIISAVPGNAEGYYGTNDSKKTVTVNGVSIKPAWFKLNSNAIPYDGERAKPGNYGMATDSGVEAVNLSVDSILSGHYTYSGGTTTYDYIGGVEDIFNKEYYTGKKYDYGVIVLRDDAVIPGTYNEHVYPFGPGVNHGSTTKINYKRTPISMKDALNKKLIRITPSESTYYNAGGSLPESVDIYFNGNTTTVEMPHNKRTYLVSDKWGYYTFITLTASKNTSCGNGRISISASDGGYPYFCVGFKGSAQAATFRINPKQVTASTIHVLSDSDYQVVYGKKTETVAVNASNPVGTIYATLKPVATGKNGGEPAKSGITLYQSYYADADGYSSGRAALKKLSTSQYDLALNGSDLYTYNVSVSNGKTGPNKTGLDFKTTASLDKTYDAYSEVVTISSVTVVYDGKEYELPTDKAFAANYEGEQVRFDSIKSVKVKPKGSGEYEATSDYYEVIYGDNVIAGKNKGTVTINLKKGPGGFSYYASKTFTFTITAAEKKTL
ncbi:MAG: hypothetical protein IJ058_07805 [Lachnospiraceae bacterium]|nr:hypothetical protein [Lachnospiraceae bacterium]